MPSFRNLFSTPSARRERKIHRLAEVGVRAPAVVTDVEERGEQRVRVTYSVEPPSAPPFQLKRDTGAWPALQPGLPALAVYDEAKPQKDHVVLDASGNAPESPHDIEVAFNRAHGLRDREPTLRPDDQHSLIAPTVHKLSAVR